MQKLIDGKLYDTESAEQVATWNNGQHGDFKFCAEELYRTENGRWFLYGEGGPMSPYTSPVPGGGVSGSSDLRALSEDDAFQWLHDKGDIATVQEHFPDRIEPA
jgi:hypothetical protein